MQVIATYFYKYLLYFMQLSVNERVNFLINTIKAGNKSAFAKEVGVGGGVIQDIVAGRLNKPSFDVLNKIVNAYPTINIEWLVTGEGHPFKARPEPMEAEAVEVFTNGLEKRHESQEIPLYDITAAAGLTSLYNSSNNILDYMKIPNLPRCDGAIYLKGDSMYPLLKHGDMVVFQRVEDVPDDIDFGEMYVVDMSTPHRERVVVKYVHKSDLGPEYIKLVSYNKNHADKDVPLKKIRAMAAVKASIRLS